MCVIPANLTHSSDRLRCDRIFFYLSSHRHLSNLSHFKSNRSGLKESVFTVECASHFKLEGFGRNSKPTFEALNEFQT